MKLRKMLAAVAIPGAALAVLAATAPAASADDNYFELEGPDAHALGHWSLAEVSGTLIDHGEIPGGSTFTIRWYSGPGVVGDTDVISVADGAWKNFVERPDRNGASFAAVHVELLGPDNA